MHIIIFNATLGVHRNYSQQKPVQESEFSQVLSQQQKSMVS